MGRNSFIPQPGEFYQNHGGGIFECIKILNSKNDGAIMQNFASGWTFMAHGIGVYEDGSIDWDYSTGGHFVKLSKNSTIKILKNAIQECSKTAQVDMTIEKMAELTKELLNERQGHKHNIAEKIADVKIMLAQMEIIFQNAEDVEQKFQIRLERLYKRLQETSGVSENE